MGPLTTAMVAFGASRAICCSAERHEKKEFAAVARANSDAAMHSPGERVAEARHAVSSATQSNSSAVPPTKTRSASAEICGICSRVRSRSEAPSHARFCTSIAVSATAPAAVSMGPAADDRHSASRSGARLLPARSPSPTTATSAEANTGADTAMSGSGPASSCPATAENDTREPISAPTTSRPDRRVGRCDDENMQKGYAAWRCRL